MKPCWKDFAEYYAKRCEFLEKEHQKRLNALKWEKTLF